MNRTVVSRREAYLAWLYQEVEKHDIQTVYNVIKNTPEIHNEKPSDMDNWDILYLLNELSHGPVTWVFAIEPALWVRYDNIGRENLGNFRVCGWPRKRGWGYAARPDGKFENVADRIMSGVKDMTEIDVEHIQELYSGNIEFKTFPIGFVKKDYVMVLDGNHRMTATVMRDKYDNDFSPFNSYVAYPLIGSSDEIC